MENKEAKKKAKELIDKMLNTDVMSMTFYCAKQCAIKVCEEVIDATDYYELGFWQQVKKEIENYER